MDEDADSEYQLLKVLAPDRTFLCADSSKNLVVLKVLEADCLYRNELHPAIRDRLATVRELPHPQVAALRSVERWDGTICAVWVYTEGLPLELAAQQSPEQLQVIQQGLMSAVSRLHALGIVHGNLHTGNIIVQPDGRVWLIDLSPYLYTDPAADLDEIEQLFDLQKRISVQSPANTEATPFRAKPLIAALFCVLVVIGIFLLVHHLDSKSVGNVPPRFPSLRQ